MSAYLDELYFDWLYDQVCYVKDRSYRKLLHILYTKEFIWLVPNDDNRVEDGKDLRYEFLSQEGYDVKNRDSHWLSLECSFLELLLGLSRRLEFEADGEAADWFWHLLENLRLDGLHDFVIKDVHPDEVDKVLDRVIWRTYSYNGGGGLFPLVYPERDQRQVEIWYQLSAYIVELGKV